MFRKTKIICTIGPASSSKKIIRKMYEAGMNGARINTAYGSPDYHELIMNKVRETANIPIIVDIKGPEIRLQVAEKQKVKKGDILKVGFIHSKLSFNHDFYDNIRVNDMIYIDNGRLRTVVVKKANREVHLSAMNHGEIENGKGVNIPSRQLSVPTLSKRDLEIIKFAEKIDAEYIALSFTRNAEDVTNLRASAHGYKGAVIAKIENTEGVNNFDAIMDAAEYIMIARGDLGVEIEPAKVPLVQKSLTKKCNQKGLPVAIATEMLESMIQQPSPTRAEVSDVANAILDGADAIMLSGETSIGKHPVRSVSMIAQIAEETEPATKSHIEDSTFVNISDAISKSIQRLCQTMPIDKVVTLTRSGYTAKMISRFKIAPLIIAVTPNEMVKSQLELVFGVCPTQMNYLIEDDRILSVAKKLSSDKLISSKDTILFTAAFRTSRRHSSNLIEIHDIAELLHLAS
ncbi:MAG: pyruvate kinase [Candidatus Bathyarchaeota archaeon]|nr:MAG: pyruvate kinase [Candidatus Bathyarchaeota archaeon]